LLTARRDLRTGVPIWQTGRIQSTSPERLATDLRADVVVVGAGISGALIAEMLASDGHEVVVVDRRGPAKGSTAASTALVQYEIDEPLTLLATLIGKADATRAWRRSHQAVAGLIARTTELAISCQFERHSTLYLAGDVLDGEGIVREHAARTHAGFETRFLSLAQLRQRFGIARAAGLLDFGNFAVDPRRLTGGYLQEAIGAGARLFAPVEIVDVKAGSTEVVAVASSGRSLRCRTLVFATGYEFPKFVPLNGHKLISTYALATRPQPRRLWPERCLIWEASDPYLYMRTTTDGRAVIGGEDEEFVDEAGRDALLNAKIERIGKKVLKLFPDLDVTPEYAWAGTFGSSETGLPSIGKIPRHPNCWAVLGYGGNGITYSRIAAEIIRTSLAGGVDPDADLYAF
jgi:glycine/D-amino acid oxidase-like deaminating enzyme